MRRRTDREHGIWLTWGGFINWNKWFHRHGIPDGRYDLLAGKDLVQIHVRENKFKRPPSPTELKQCGDYLMIENYRGLDRFRRALEESDLALKELETVNKIKGMYLNPSIYKSKRAGCSSLPRFF